MAFFDPVAPEYDKWYQTPIGRFLDEVETKLAFDLFTPHAGARVLDAGCGSGNFSLKLAGKGCRVIGIDISPVMLDVARKKAAAARLAVEFLEMDVYDLRFPSATFDAVFSMACFEFITEPARAFAELWRVLKPGGDLLIGAIHRDSAWGRFYREEARKPGSVFRHAVFTARSDLENLAPEYLNHIAECVFVSPTAPPECFNWEEERRLAKTERGGFIIATWHKPLAGGLVFGSSEC
ncbi:MAG TPA: class I SAM-dependent methyltransferase [Firmicutes bacterium]|nr:class I SAM-dependent methyltransferase [Bacillota bacterium]